MMEILLGGERELKIGWEHGVSVLPGYDCNVLRAPKILWPLYYHVDEKNTAVEMDMMVKIVKGLSREIGDGRDGMRDERKRALVLCQSNSIVTVATSSTTIGS
ncbi:hypothetical protein FNV43_RR18146 [Rhamnella rubrinervis]|uniref:Uncharacterized protein n=1 Tax=Rhamnella rubrinervis TaxID=2594499 RepID=A0A8K0E362_9ROSA|nr:hypothetical protein FNV43_RR18146 [Rhamnella rubrinervis]